MIRDVKEINESLSNLNDKKKKRRRKKKRKIAREKEKERERKNTSDALSSVMRTPQLGERSQDNVRNSLLEHFQPSIHQERYISENIYYFLLFFFAKSVWIYVRIVTIQYEVAMRRHVYVVSS